MTKYIFLDADAIINAEASGAQSGNIAAILDLWKAYAIQQGAQVIVTDVVLAEANES